MPLDSIASGLSLEIPFPGLSGGRFVGIPSNGNIELKQLVGLISSQPLNVSLGLPSFPTLTSVGALGGLTVKVKRLGFRFDSALNPGSFRLGDEDEESDRESE